MRTDCAWKKLHASDGKQFAPDTWPPEVMLAD